MCSRYSAELQLYVASNLIRVTWLWNNVFFTKSMKKHNITIKNIKFSSLNFMQSNSELFRRRMNLFKLNVLMWKSNQIYIIKSLS